MMALLISLPTTGLPFRWKTQIVLAVVAASFGDAGETVGADAVVGRGTSGSGWFSAWQDSARTAAPNSSASSVAGRRVSNAAPRNGTLLPARKSANRLDFSAKLTFWGISLIA